jgi:hypothetical protein
MFKRQEEVDEMVINPFLLFYKTRMISFPTKGTPLLIFQQLKKLKKYIKSYINIFKLLEENTYRSLLILIF